MLSDSLLSDMVKNIEETFNNVDRYQQLYSISREQAGKELALYSGIKDRAALGDRAAREFIISRYAILLKAVYHIDEASMEQFISFEDIFRNSIGIIFEMLLDIGDISVLLEKYPPGVKVTSQWVLEAARHEAGRIKEHFTEEKKLRLLALLVYSREYGQDVIDTLQYHNINEIGIIDKDYIYIVYKGVKLHLSFLSISDPGVVENIQKKTTRNSVVNYDRQNPSVVAAKNNSSRITVAGYEITPDEGDLYYNERIFNLKKISLEEMRDSLGTIDELVYSLLELNQKGRGSHFITGADMGVGKSTFLLAMLEKIPDKWGIGILDTQNELQARKKFPEKNIITLIENPKRTIAQCFEFMLKTARDIVYVGEITMPGEMAELINASLRLNSGVGATMHSLSPQEVVTNARNLMMRTEMYNDPSIAEADLARGLDLIIHLARLDDGRIVVESITELEYVELDRYVEPVTTGKLSDKLINLVDMAQMALQKYLYRKSYRLNELIHYDHARNMWIPVNMPSAKYLGKLGKYVSHTEIQAFVDSFLKVKAEKEGAENGQAAC